MIQFGIGAQRRHETPDSTTGAVAPPLEDDLVANCRVVFAVGAVNDLTQFLGEQRGGILVTDPLPLALATFSGAHQRRHDAIGVVDVEKSGIALGAQLAARIGVIHIAFQFHHAPVFHIGVATIFDVARHAGIGDPLPFLAGHRRSILSTQFLFHGFQAIAARTQSGCASGQSAQLDEVAAIDLELLCHVSLPNRSVHQ